MPDHPILLQAAIAAETKTTPRAYLDALYAGCDGVLEIRAFPAQTSAPLTDLASLRPFLHAHRTEGLYHGVATRIDASSGALTNCRHLPALFADLDVRSDAHPSAPTETAARAALGGCPMPPSIVVHSGGGLYPFWLLREPLDLQDASDRATAYDLLKRLAAYLGADPAAAEPARVLRLPGTKNFKYTPARPVTIEVFEPTRRYNPSDLDDWLPAAPRPTAKATATADGSTVGAGGRNAHLCRMAGTMRRPGLSATAILAALRVANAEQCDPPLDDAEVQAIATSVGRYAPADVTLPAAPRPDVTPCGLAEVHTIFRRWLGEDYDLDAVNAVLATAAAERLDGDPLWMLLISGSGNAKTETVQALAGAGATITSTITSDGALLSGSPQKDKRKDSTGGLLRTLGERGLLVIKDVTSILSMNRDARGAVLAALREVHDGRWERNIGTDGGRTLTWTGRIAIVGAVTTAWDRAHDVIASMGDRFVVVRVDSSKGRLPAGQRAIGNTGDEVRMRAELAAVLGGAVASVDPTTAITVTEAERDRILAAADVVTLARTGVDYDYRGDVIDAHAPEMPTRFAKQLAQLLRGAVAVGMPRRDALRLAIRCARDSMPPLRLAILDDIAAHPGSLTKDVRRRLAKPRATVDRQLQSLHMLNVLACAEEEGVHRGQDVTHWRYTLAEGISPDVLDPDSVPEMSVTTMDVSSSLLEPKNISGDISGTEIVGGDDWEAVA